MFRLPRYNAEIAAARTLSQVLIATHKLTRPSHDLDIDGAPFSYVVNEIIFEMRRAILDVGETDDMANRILRNLRDRVSVRETEIRREVKRLVREENVPSEDWTWLDAMRSEPSVGIGGDDKTKPKSPFVSTSEGQHHGEDQDRG
jgi:hypothetical protein